MKLGHLALITLLSALISSCNFFASPEGSFAAVFTGSPGQRSVGSASAVVSRAGVAITADYPFEEYYATAYGDFFRDLSSVSATTPSEYQLATMNAMAYGAGSSSEKAIFIRPPNNAEPDAVDLFSDDPWPLQTVPDDPELEYIGFWVDVDYSFDTSYLVVELPGSDENTRIATPSTTYEYEFFRTPTDDSDQQAVRIYADEDNDGFLDADKVTYLGESQWKIHLRDLLPTVAMIETTTNEPVFGGEKLDGGPTISGDDTRAHVGSFSYHHVQDAAELVLPYNDEPIVMDDHIPENSTVGWSQGRTSLLKLPFEAFVVDQTKDSRAVIEYDIANVVWYQEQGTPDEFRVMLAFEFWERFSFDFIEMEAM